MADNHSKEVRSKNMSHIRSTNSKPEEIVRKYLFAEGFRYRKNVRTLPGCPDIVLPKHKTVIFVNGCFWHKHDCPRFVWPSSNTDYWYPKILRNIERDQSNTNKLQELGWQVIVVWECELKKPLLQRYRKTKGEIEEKRRCWHVEYEDVPQFHMDVIPAVFRSEYIDITDHDEEKDSYEYIGSNPRGYVEWFRERMAKRRQALREQYCSAHRDVIKSQADVEALKEYHFKTPLQKAIQILKRHRDIMFDGDSSHLKPISIIITTVAAQLYNNEDNIVDALTTILLGAERYIRSHMVGSEYHIDNPCYTGGDTENFADKWNEHPERADTFFMWLNKAKSDLIDPRLYGFVRTEMADNVKKSLGEITHNRVFRQMAEEERKNISNQRTKVNPATGALTAAGSITVPRSHHYGV